MAGEAPRWRSGGQSNAFTCGPGARGDVSPRGRARCLRSRLPYGRGGGEDIGGSPGYLGLAIGSGSRFSPVMPLRRRPGPTYLRVAGAGGILGADRGFPAQEVEVAALVGLEHVIEEEAAVAARVVRRARLPARAAAGQLVVGNLAGSAGGSGRPARSGRRSRTSASGPPAAASGDDVQHHGAVGRPAHARVRDAHHVPHARSSSFFGIGAAPHSGMPGAPFGPARLSTSTDSRPRPGRGRRCARADRRGPRTPPRARDG